MDTFVPALLPEETLYSWISRWAILSGYPSRRVAICTLLGSDNMQLTSAFPNYIPKNHKFSSRTLAVLVNEHTVLPFFRAFVTNDVYQKAYLSMLAGRTEFLHSRLSLAANRISSDAMKYCPICAHNDLLRHGHTYWHISHPLPLITVCPKHSIYLVSLPIARRELTLPPETDFVSSGKHCVSAKEHKFSGLLYHSFIARKLSLESQKLRRCYKIALYRDGLANKNGSIKTEKLRYNLRDSWLEERSDANALEQPPIFFTT